LSDDALRARAALLRTIAAGVLAASSDLERLVRESPEALRRVRAAPGDTLAVMAAGAVLHAFYNELEKVFELVGSQVDGFEPTGEDWHARLADQMFVEVPSLRPAVLPMELRPRLRDCRAFRHLFRHLYALDLDGERVTSLLEGLPELWGEAQSGLKQFAKSLVAIANALTEAG
jgi:hypothetical protein